MNKQQFLNELDTKLSSRVNSEEKASLMQYYDGYIDEAVDFGMSEAEVIEQLGDIDTLVAEMTQGLSDENIDISARELAVTTKDITGLEMDLRNTSVELIYDDSIKNISVKVDKRYKQDYLVKTIDGVFKVKQIKSAISVGPGFVLRYNRGDTLGKRSIFDLDFDFDLQISMRKLYVRIPTNFDLDTYIQTSNAKIEVSDGHNVVQTAPYELITSNSSIILSDMKIQRLKVKTNNGGIKIANVDSETMELITSNAKVSLDSVLAKDLRIKSSNGRIELEDVLFKVGKLKTSNSKIHVYLKDNDMSKRIHFKTSNAKVTIDDDRHANYGDITLNNQGEVMELEAITSNARIELENFH